MQQVKVMEDIFPCNFTSNYIHNLFLSEYNKILLIPKVGKQKKNEDRTKSKLCGHIPVFIQNFHFTNILEKLFIGFYLCY